MNATEISQAEGGISVGTKSGRKISSPLQKFLVLANLKAALAARRRRQLDLAFSVRVAPSVFSEVINERRKLRASCVTRFARALEADRDCLFESVTHIRLQVATSSSGPRNVGNTPRENRRWRTAI